MVQLRHGQIGLTVHSGHSCRPSVTLHIQGCRCQGVHGSQSRAEMDWGQGIWSTKGLWTMSEYRSEHCCTMPGRPSVFYSVGFALYNVYCSERWHTVLDLEKIKVYHLEFRLRTMDRAMQWNLALNIWVRYK